MVEEYFDEFVDADGMELLILGKKFISLCTNSKVLILRIFVYHMN